MLCLLQLQKNEFIYPASYFRDTTFGVEWTFLYKVSNRTM